MRLAFVLGSTVTVCLLACSGDSSPASSSPGEGGELGPSVAPTPLPPIGEAPPAGATGTGCAIPNDARAESTGAAPTVVGDGSAESCTSRAFVDAVAKGGVITFACGAAPKTIVLEETAKVVNDAAKVVIDGGDKITLSGGGRRRILYQNTCDEKQKFTTSHCQDQPTPELTVQNITFVDGFADDEEGGGAIFDRGGRLKIVHSRFFRNKCDAVGQDIGGAAVRAFDQSEGKPLYVVASTFGGATGLGNSCANGGGLSSIGVSYTVIDSVFSHNEATGNGANPKRPGTPGGGSGGAIYNDGNTFTLSLCGTTIEDNHANEGGGAIFFVSNDRTGSLRIDRSTLRRNPSDGFETDGFPGIFVLAKEAPVVTASSIE